MFVFEEIFKEKRSEISKNLDLRLQRALSWIKQASQQDQDAEVKLFYHWIALNSLYISEINQNFEQRQHSLRRFLHYLSDHDVEKKISRTLMSRLDLSLHDFLQSPYLSYEFWRFQHAEMDEMQFQHARQIEKQELLVKIQEQQDAELLSFILQRIAMLHTQMSLGGVINQSQVYRQLISDAAQILTVLLPIFMTILLENPQGFDYSTPFFPVIQFS
ncbi:HEPN domain-containing protein [Acinetobacter ihumii]|uniref:HEPN domain-containing protein n=1 Tax=Acinetobacter ihumii TaxID=2483802 RepID=UPI001032258D|nr:HEPN domain-containing protein [Acinetobacter ihumii]